MKLRGPTVSPTRMRWQRVASFVALGSFFLAAAILYSLDRLVWHNFVAPHAALVNCVPKEGVVLGQQVEDVGAGVNACAFPRAIYQYEVDGRTFESSVIRHSNYTRTNAEEANVGEVRFYGADRRQRAEAFLQQYPAGRKVTVWLNLAQPSEAMLIRQELDVSPFMLGLIPGIFVPFFWMFLVLALHTFIGRPTARWTAFGWGLLSLGSLAPLFWQYQELLGEAGPDHFVRLQNVGLGLAVVIVVASLTARQLRSAMAIGLILCFTFVGGLGAASAAAIGRFHSILGWIADPAGVFTRSMECALIIGTVVGLLLGLGAWLGLVTIRPVNDDSCGIRGQR